MPPGRYTPGKYKLATQRVVIFLWTQEFRDVELEVELTGPTQFPHDMLRAVTPACDELFSPTMLYRTTGVILGKRAEAYYGQLDLFGATIRLQCSRLLFFRSLPGQMQASQEPLLTVTMVVGY
jgi:hypothetical protein